ncbi:MAG: signal peptidase I [archaeon]
MKKRAPPKHDDHWLKKAWYFIWYDNSPLSWAVNILLAFVLIKFVIYPGIGLLFGTSLPVVAVVSTSMEHQGNFDQWWQTHQEFYVQRNISEQQFRTFIFVHGFNKGDIMVLIGKKPTEITQGDVIVFQARKPYPIIHRVVAIHDGFFETKGDNNLQQIVSLDLNEQYVTTQQLIGKAVFRIPLLGWVKIWFVDFLGLFGVPAF